MSKDIPVFLSLGAGVQSSTLALMAASGEFEVMPKAAIFADTQDEPASVYRWLDWLEKQLPFPVIRVTKGKLSEESLKMRVSKNGRAFSATNIPFFTKAPDGSLGKIPHRSCTADFKIKPIIKQLRAEIGAAAFREWRKKHRESLQRLAAAKKEGTRDFAAFRECQGDPLTIQWIGISLDETRRMKPSRDPWAVCEWPLVDRRMSRRHCMEWMKRKSYPTPPRSACLYCPYHGAEEWRRMQTEEPEAFYSAVQFEKDIQEAKRKSDNFTSVPYLHRSCVPLDQIDFRSDVERGQVLLWDEECEGMCGV